jgi:hypothetical protein
MAEHKEAPAKPTRGRSVRVEVDPGVARVFDQVQKDWSKTLNVMGGSVKVFESVRAANKLAQALTENPAIKATREWASVSPALNVGESLRPSLAETDRLDESVMDSLHEAGLRKARAEQAAVDMAKSIMLLVELAGRQEQAIASMAADTEQLLDNQLQAATTARRWRWATFVVALVAAAAAIIAVAQGSI